MAKRTRPNISPKKEVQDVATEQEHIIQQLKTNEAEPKQKKIRFTMDMPAELHARIKAKATRQGQMMKGYFLNLAWNDLEGK